jgi:torulene dioxygenase
MEYFTELVSYLLIFATIDIDILGLGTFNIRKNDGTIFHFNHPFDGLAMLHRFEIHGGQNARITYTSRHTANGVKSRILRDDSTLVFFGPDPCKTIFGRLQSVYHQLLDLGRGEIERRMETDAEGENINVTITPNFPLGEDLEKEWGVNAGMALVVKTDANMLQLIDNETLEPKKLFTYAVIDKEYKDRFAASHHQHDDESGEWFNFILEVFPKPTWRVFSYSTPKIPGPTKVKKFQPITENLSCPVNFILPTKSLKPSYTHSFALTKNYVIIPNWSYYFLYNTLSLLWYGNAYESLYFDRNRPTLFHVLSRESGLHVATYESDSAFAFHTANAWDEDGTIWMDIATYPDSGIIDASFEFARMYHEEYVKPASYRKTETKTGDENVCPSEIRRYKLSDIPKISSNTPRRAEYEVLGLDLDLPRFDPRRKNKPYRYLYGTCRNKNDSTHKNADGVIFNSVQKMDLGLPPTLSEQLISDVPVNKIYGSGPNTCRFDPLSASCSEPIFLPNPSGTDEDDGIVLTIINEIQNEDKEICALVVLNAKDMTEMARTEVGPWHTKTVHGSFVDQTGKAVRIS